MRDHAHVEPSYKCYVCVERDRIRFPADYAPRIDSRGGLWVDENKLPVPATLPPDLAQRAEKT